MQHCVGSSHFSFPHDRLVLGCSGPSGSLFSVRRATFGSWPGPYWPWVWSCRTCCGVDHARAFCVALLRLNRQWLVFRLRLVSYLLTPRQEAGRGVSCQLRRMVSACCLASLNRKCSMSFRKRLCSVQLCDDECLLVSVSASSALLWGRLTSLCCRVW